MKTPIRINLTDTVGSNLCVSSEDGGAVFEKLEAAVGRLAEHLSIAQIHERIAFPNLGEEDGELMDRVLENAVRYYEAPDRFRKSLAIEEEAEK